MMGIAGTVCWRAFTAMRKILYFLGILGLLNVASATVIIFSMFFGRFTLTDLLLGALVWAVIVVGILVAGLYDVLLIP